MCAPIVSIPVFLISWHWLHCLLVVCLPITPHKDNPHFYLWSQCPPKGTFSCPFSLLPWRLTWKDTTVEFLALWFLVCLGQWERLQQETGGQGVRSWCLFLAPSLRDGFRLAVPLTEVHSPLLVLFFLLKLSGVKSQFILLPIKCRIILLWNTIGINY